MKKKSFVSKALVAVLTMAMLATGCAKKSEPVTLEEVVEQMEATQLNSGVITTNVTWQGGEKFDNAKMDMGMDIQWVNEPMGVYIGQTMSYGEDDIVMEMYLVEEEEQQKAYMSVDDKWYVLNSSLLGHMEDLLSIKDKVSVDVSGFTPEQLGLQCTNADATVNGKDAYEFVITGDLAEMEQLIDGMMESVSDLLELGEFGNFSTEDLEITYTLYIEKETYYPLSCSFELKSAQDSRNQIGTLLMTMVYEKINEIQSVVVPEEVVDTAVDFGELF